MEMQRTVEIFHYENLKDIKMNFEVSQHIHRQEPEELLHLNTKET